MTKFFLSLLLFSTALTLKAEWPSRQGPFRNSLTKDTLSALPTVDAWQMNCGEGGSTPLVVDQKVYTTGWTSDRDTIRCLDLVSGKEIWSTSYDAPRWGRHATGDQSLYSGTTSTPFFDTKTGWLYTLSCDGDLQAWDTNRAGRKMWHNNLYQQFKVGQRPKPTRTGHRDYGYTTSPLVYGNSVIVEVGSSEHGNLIAFDKKNGRTLWQSENKDLAGHCGGPVLLKVEGIPCVASLTLYGLHVARLDPGNEGQTVATHEWRTDYANSIATPAVSGNSILITSGYNQKAFSRLDISLRNGAREVWKTRTESKICTPLIYQNAVYWVSKNFTCLDFSTGKINWSTGSYGDAGSLILARDKLIGFADKGTLFAARLNSKKLEFLAERKGYFRDEVWPHLVLSDNHLILKDRKGNLRCFNLKNQPAVIATKPEVPLKAIPGKALVDLTSRSPLLRKLTKRGKASISTSGQLSLKGGSFTLPEADEMILTACKQTNQFTLEVIVTPDNLKQFGPARMVSFSEDAYQRNLTLGQEKKDLILRLRTAGSDDNGMKNQTVLGQLSENQTVHILLSYSSGELVCYINGKEAMNTDKVTGDLSNWDPMHFVIGNEWKDDRAWKGQIAGLKLDSGFASKSTALRRYRSAKALNRAIK